MLLLLFQKPVTFLGSIHSLYYMNYANVSILTYFHVFISSPDVLNKDNGTNSKHRMYMLQNLFFILIKFIYCSSGFFTQKSFECFRL